MNLWQMVTWDVARAGGLLAYVLLTVSVALGLALSMQLQSPSKWPRLINSELHNFLTLLALVFTVIHVLAVWIDPFTQFGLNEILIPLVSHYRPLWMALGIVALYLGIAVGISTLLRSTIGYTWWRRLHLLTLLAFGMVTVHGIATGSDTKTWWGLAIYVASVALVGGLLIRRLLVPATARGRSYPAFAIATALLLVIGTIWTMLGPLRPGWNAIAGGSNSTASIKAANTQAVAQSQSQPNSQQQQNKQSGDPFASPFSASAEGQITRNTDVSGVQTIHMDLTLGNGVQGNMVIMLQSQGQRGGEEEERGTATISSSQVTLGQTAGAPLYQGYLTTLKGEHGLRMVALLTRTGSDANTTGPQIQVRLQMRVTSPGHLSGTAQGIPVQGNSSSQVSQPQGYNND
ncbi:MAG: ferric reductase-like transmembrane domain-containing protein [Ktedonobacteraceae bacterium]|nr:ferric reductase-like transmembrane domain-containing protein [Ktedonobacteraceae bacterium]